MSKNIPDYYLYSAASAFNPQSRFAVLDVYRYNEDHVQNCRRHIRKPSANIAYLLLERQYRQNNYSDVRDVANGAWRIVLDIEQGPQSKQAETRVLGIRRAINRRLTLLEDKEYIQIYGN